MTTTSTDTIADVLHSEYGIPLPKAYAIAMIIMDDPTPADSNNVYSDHIKDELIDISNFIDSVF
jgi:hypothetical protein